MEQPRTKVELAGVPETALWNLYQRAAAARAGYLDDPRAVDVIERLDYSFDRFDSPYGRMAARMHALRVRTVDAALSRLLADAPEATVVALGEGLETQFWRVDNGRVRWLTVDLPELVTLRGRVLPDDTRIEAWSGSAVDLDWMSDVDPGRPVVITAQGLLMYFEREQVHRLITACAQARPGAWLVFDAVTPALQRARRRGPTPGGYQPPEWTWTVDDPELRELRGLGGVRELTEVPQADGGGVIGVLRRIPVLNQQIPVLPVFRARLGAPPTS